MATTFTTFGLKKVEVKVQGAGTTWTQIPSAESAMFKMTVQQTKQWGDDVLQQVFNHSQEGQITVKSNIQSMAVFSLLSGNTPGSFTDGVLGTGSSIPFGTEGELNVNYLSVRALARMRRTDNNTVSAARLIWYRCQMHTAFDGLGFERAKNMDLTYTFDVLSSPLDELGVALACNAFGRFEGLDTYSTAC